MRNWGEDLSGELFRKENGAFGLEIPCAATERQKMLLVTFCAAYSGEPSLKPSTGQEVIDRTYHHGAQWPRSRLEALFVGADIAVKVSLKQLIKSRSFGMPGAILRRGFRNNAARSILLGATIGMDNERAKGDGRRVQSHGGQQTSCGFRTATDLIAGETIEPSS